MVRGRFAGGGSRVVGSEVAGVGSCCEETERGGRREEGEAGVVNRGTEGEVVVGDLEDER